MSPSMKLERVSSWQSLRVKTFNLRPYVLHGDHYSRAVFVDYIQVEHLVLLVARHLRAEFMAQ